MARYTQDYMLLAAPEATWPEVQRYFTNKGFTYKDFEGEMVFQKGNGWLAAPTFAKVAYYSDRIRVELWMKNAILPYLYVGEIGIEGFYGWAVKGKMKEAALMFDRLFGGPAARIGCNAWLRDNGPKPMQQPVIPQNSPCCPHCDAPAVQGSRFCSNCGNAI